MRRSSTLASLSASRALGKGWRAGLAARYAGAQMRLLEGGDHALSDFDEHLPHILSFLRLCD